MELFRLLHALLHGTKALVYSNHQSCSLHVSGQNLGADCQQCTLVPSFNSVANAALISVQALPVQSHHRARTDVDLCSFETTIKC